LLLPLTAVGFDAAMGLLIATFLQQRTYAVLAQILYIVFRIMLVGGLVFGATQFVNGDLTTTDLGSWALIGAFASLGDWGLAFLNLGFFGEIWATIPYGIFLGLALLIFSLIQAALTDLIISFSVRVAERRG
jgi:glycopeptide antibiotics resistance protein